MLHIYIYIYIQLWQVDKEPQHGRKTFYNVTY